MRRWDTGRYEEGVSSQSHEVEDEPALFHVKHDDGDSEDLDEGEAEEAIELCNEVEPSAKKRGKRKAVVADEDEDDAADDDAGAVVDFVDNAGAGFGLHTV